MNNKEAVKTLLTGMFRDTMSNRINIDSHMEDDFLYAIGMAVSALMKQEEEKGKHVQRDVTPFEENGGIIYTKH